ncbi:hypothetical protein [Jiulongibacter sediminis]|jgi:hypothetical protein|uniref:hypothetical protein n=1 Tax=Jiulongibacter sediminis TaxID=1605367 RepID=UPI0026EC3E9A|nr:hypothetical protein [Jiulongibacter sediminis]
MNASNPSLKFEYLYRDGANWKTWGEIILDNPNSLSIEEATQKIQPLLIDGEFFNPDQCGIQRFQNLPFDPAFDHECYEFHLITETFENVTSDLSIDQFLNILPSVSPQRHKDSKYHQESS